MREASRPQSAPRCSAALLLLTSGVASVQPTFVRDSASLISPSLVETLLTVDLDGQDGPEVVATDGLGGTLHVFGVEEEAGLVLRQRLEVEDSSFLGECAAADLEGDRDRDLAPPPPPLGPRPEARPGARGRLRGGSRRRPLPPGHPGRSPPLPSARPHPGPHHRTRARDPRALPAPVRHGSRCSLPARALKPPAARAPPSRSAA